MDEHPLTSLAQPPKSRFQSIMKIVFNVTHALLFALYALILYFERDSYSRYTGSYYDSFYDYVSEYVLGFAVVSLGVTLILCVFAAIPRIRAKRGHTSKAAEPVRQPKAPKEPKPPKHPKQPKAPKQSLASRPARQAPPTPQPDQKTIPETLRQYKALLDEGLITEDEFTRLKSKLLDL